MLVHGQNWAPVRKKRTGFSIHAATIYIIPGAGAVRIDQAAEPPAAVSSSCGEPVRTGIPDAYAFSQHIRADFPSAFRWQDNHEWKAHANMLVQDTKALLSRCYSRSVNIVNLFASEQWRCSS